MNMFRDKPGPDTKRRRNMASEPVQSIIRKQIKPALVIFFILTLVTGIVYPLVVTGFAQVIFPAQSNGNLIERDGQTVGSALIGQPFTSPGYFWAGPPPRPRFRIMRTLLQVQTSDRPTLHSSMRSKPGSIFSEQRIQRIPSQFRSIS